LSSVSCGVGGVFVLSIVFYTLSNVIYILYHRTFYLSRVLDNLVLLLYITRLIIYSVNKAAVWLREKRGDMSFRELGAKVGLSHGTLANAEDGIASETTWIALAEYFGENPQQVLYWAGKTKDQPPTKEKLERAQAIVNRIATLRPDLQELADSFIDMLLERERKERNNNGKRK
jgi:hypothetical protein